MNVVEKNPNDLIFYENNPRDNDGAVPIVKNSIERFGFRVPVMIDKDNVIICGHTRVKAALELGLESIPCTIEEDMSEEEVRAFRLVENKTHELSFWDRSLLDVELKGLEDDFEMEDFGFTMDEGVSIQEVNEFFAEVEGNQNKRETSNTSNMVECPNCKFVFTP